MPAAQIALCRAESTFMMERWRSRPISRVLSGTVIPLGSASPHCSSSLPGPDAGRVMGSLFGLAPGGVCRAGPLPDSRCALTAPFHPCLCLAFRRMPGHRRYLSVALSVGSRRPGVTWHRALWSPDFPRHRMRTWMTRLSGRLRRGHCRMRHAGSEPRPREHAGTMACKPVRMAGAAVCLRLLHHRQTDLKETRQWEAPADCPTQRHSCTTTPTTTPTPAAMSGA